MLNLIPHETDALRALLERLFPGTPISETGLALLAAQITELETGSEALPNEVEFQVTVKNIREMTGAGVLLSLGINNKSGYGTNSNARQRALPRAS